jgi:hypothetical protein
MKLSKVLFATVVAFGFARAPRADACGNSDPEKPVVFETREYSSAAMGDAITALRTCETESLCGPFAVIKSWGAKAAPALLDELKIDTNGYVLRHVLNLLEAAKVPGSGVKMFAIASAMKSTYDAGEVNASAIKIDGKLVFTHFSRALMKETDESRATALRQGMMQMPDEALAYITREMQYSGNPVALATLADTIVTKDNAKTIAGLIRLTKNPIARHRLAAAAIRGEFVKDELFDTFHASLTNKDADTRKDALVYLNVDTIPAQLKAPFLALVQKQVANGSLAMESRTARTLLDLGARVRATFDTLFTGLDSAKQHEQWRALGNIRKLGSLVPDDLRPIYIQQVEKVLSTSTNNSTKNLGDKALKALRASSPGA